MNRSLVIAALVIATLTGGIAYSISAQAEESAPMTEEHIARIRNNCVEAQASLFQLHAADGGLRVDRGQIYESISTKLMAPFNSRLVLNRVSDATLLSTASEYDKQLQIFRLRYQEYEEAMSAVLRINCVNQPVAFYDSVADTRQKRKLTHDSAMDLQKTILKYGNEVEVFAKNFTAGKS